VRWRTAARRVHATFDIRDGEPAKRQDQEVAMANALGFIFGIVAPVAGISWLVFLH
jgi:hypothetical protein